MMRNKEVLNEIRKQSRTLIEEKRKQQETSGDLPERL